MKNVLKILLVAMLFSYALPSRAIEIIDADMCPTNADDNTSLNGSTLLNIYHFKHGGNIAVIDKVRWMVGISTVTINPSTIYKLKRVEAIFFSTSPNIKGYTINCVYQGRNYRDLILSTKPSNTEAMNQSGMLLIPLRNLYWKPFYSGGWNYYCGDGSKTIPTTNCIFKFMDPDYVGSK